MEFLVGALVLGTAFPHLLTGFSNSLPWRFALVATTGLAVSGGILIFVLVPDGPHRAPRQKLDLSAVAKVFKNQPFRAAAFGYFGHMWELFAFWAFVPVILTTYLLYRPESSLEVPLLCFLIIGSGGPTCVRAGYMSQKTGAEKTASVALFLSFLCCLLSPAILYIPPGILMTFLMFWGLTVIADSPIFSTLVAHHAPPESKGLALTIVNCIGFAITMVSVQLINALQGLLAPEHLCLVLAAGPLPGLPAIRKNHHPENQ